jgi:hypothetical protein
MSQRGSDSKLFPSSSSEDDELEDADSSNNGRPLGIAEFEILV